MLVDAGGMIDVLRRLVRYGMRAARRVARGNAERRDCASAGAISGWWRPDGGPTLSCLSDLASAWRVEHVFADPAATSPAMAR